MTEIHTLKRYEVRGSRAFDLSERRFVSPDEACAALEFAAIARAVMARVSFGDGHDKALCDVESCEEAFENVLDLIDQPEK